MFSQDFPDPKLTVVCSFLGLLSPLFKNVVKTLVLSQSFGTQSELQNFSKISVTGSHVTWPVTLIPGMQSIWSKLPSVLSPIPHCLGLPFSSPPHSVASSCSRHTQRILFVTFGIHSNPQFLLTLSFSDFIHADLSLS